MQPSTRLATTASACWPGDAALHAILLHVPLRHVGFGSPRHAGLLAAAAETRLKQCSYGLPLLVHAGLGPHPPTPLHPLCSRLFNNLLSGTLPPEWGSAQGSFPRLQVCCRGSCRLPCAFGAAEPRAVWCRRWWVCSHGGLQNLLPLPVSLSGGSGWSC